MLHRGGSLTLQQIFELITGQTPFNLLGFDELSHFKEVINVIKQNLPERWRGKWRKIQDVSVSEDLNWNVKALLDEVYFDKKIYTSFGFFRKHISKVGNLTNRLLRLEPSSGASIQGILDDPWFQKK